jgi:uncharacterized membrane protein YuzA (DUF378 family)
MARDVPDVAGRTVPQLLALIFGVVYLLVGVAGFFVTGFDNFASHTDETLLGFEVNPLHNIVHILIGAAGIALSSTLARARLYGWLLVAGYGLVFLYGLYAVDNPDDNILSINAADNVLHILTVLAGLAIALLPVRGRVRGGMDVPHRT